MTEADLDVLVGRISKGEDRAFESVMQAFRWHVFQYLRRFGLTYETAEDVVQETFFATYKAIRRGQYQHHNTAAFAGWLRIIARRIMIHAHIATSNDMIEPLDFEVSGDVGARDPAEAGPGPDMQAEQSELFAFLQRQLDEALIANQSTDEGRDVGLIKKMAFLRFYVDQLSQSEILDLAFEDAVRLNILGQLTSSTINNWISRGDILKTLVHHLVQRHPEIVDKLSKHWTASTARPTSSPKS